MPRTITPRAHKTAQGKWRCKLGNQWVTGGPWETEAEALHAGVLALEDRKRGVLGQREETTVAEFAELWTRTEEIVEGRRLTGPYAHRRDTPTMRHNAERISTFVAQYGDVRLGEVDRPLARAFWTANPSRGSALRAMFNDALDDGYITGNPFAKLKLDKARNRTKGRKRIQALTAPEVEILADSVKVLDAERFRPMFHAAIIFAAYSGLRHGEQTALRWSDVDFEDHTISVIRQWRTKEAEHGPVKNREEMTQADGRVVALFPRAEQALHSIRETYGEGYCKEFSDPDLIFTTVRGCRLNHRNHYYFWKQVRPGFLATLTDERINQLRGNNADKAPLHWHDLRHYCASWLLDMGASDRDVAEQLGHTDGGRLVAELYGHTYNENALGRLQAAGGRPASTQSRRRKEG